MEASNRVPDNVSYMRLLRALNGRMIGQDMPEQQVVYIARLVRQLIELNNEAERERRQQQKAA